MDRETRGVPRARPLATSVARQNAGPVFGSSTSPPAGSRHLFKHWGALQRTVRAAKLIALFLDFDGTLAPYRSHPEDARMPLAARRALQRLVRLPRLRTFVVSGRRLRDVRRRVGVRKITYLGLHGWERSRGRPGGIGLHRFMQRLRREVESKVAGSEGVWVEDKYVGFVVHSRYAPARERKAARTALDQSLAAVQSRVRVLRGTEVWEVLPAEVRGKGEAVRGLLHELRDGALPVYVGDDLSDEAAFGVLPQGITVRVGKPRKTLARYTLRDPDEVREFLEMLEAEVS